MAIADDSIISGATITSKTPRLFIKRVFNMFIHVLVNKKKHFVLFEYHCLNQDGAYQIFKNNCFWPNNFLANSVNPSKTWPNLTNPCRGIMRVFIQPILPSAPKLISNLHCTQKTRDKKSDTSFYQTLFFKMSKKNVLPMVSKSPDNYFFGQLIHTMYWEQKLFLFSRNFAKSKIEGTFWPVE